VLVLVLAAATPATTAATVAMVPAVAPAALAPAPPAPEDAPPACAIALVPTIAKKNHRRQLFHVDPQRNHKGELDGATTLAYPVKPLQTEPIRTRRKHRRSLLYSTALASASIRARARIEILMPNRYILMTCKRPRALRSIRAIAKAP